MRKKERKYEEMKRRTVLLLTAAMLLTLLTGCGKSSTEVPEVYLDQAVQEFMEDEYPHRAVASDEYTDFNYVAFHDPDKTMHTDSMYFIVSVCFPYGKQNWSAEQVYQYSRSNDYWTEMDEWEWSFDDEYVSNDSIIGNTFSGPLDAKGSNYTVTVDALDYNGSSITCSYTIHDYSYSYSPDCSGSGTFQLYTNYPYKDGLKLFRIVNEKVQYTLSVSPVYGVRIRSGYNP